MTRVRPFLMIGLFSLGLSCGLVWHFVTPSHATLAYFDDAELSPEQRSQMYSNLAQQAAALEQQGNAVKTVARLAHPTVVHIEAEKPESAPPQAFAHGKVVEEAGSGVIITMHNRFYILTNRHVIKDARLNDVHIHLADGRQVSPARAWSDGDTDIAVMSLTVPGLIAAHIGDSDKVEIGDFVLAVGSPFGLSQSVTYGIISAKGRRDLALGTEGVRFQDFMQTDAAINPGNSGGPLINLRGEVIGLNTAIASNSGGNEGIGFTIPVNMVMVVARQLVDTGKVVRAFLGVNLDSKFSSTQALRLGLPRRQGAHITSITPNSPAELSKLEVDDVILQFNGVSIEDDTHLVNVVSLTEVNKEVPVVVFRGQKPIHLNVTVGDRSAFDRPTASPGRTPVELGRAPQ